MALADIQEYLKLLPVVKQAPPGTSYEVPRRGRLRSLERTNGLQGQEPGDFAPRNSPDYLRGFDVVDPLSKLFFDPLYFLDPQFISPPGQGGKPREGVAR